MFVLGIHGREQLSDQGLLPILSRGLRGDQGAPFAALPESFVGHEHRIALRHRRCVIQK